MKWTLGWGCLVDKQMDYRKIGNPVAKTPTERNFFPGTLFYVVGTRR
jgi:hypothetical protein